MLVGPCRGTKTVVPALLISSIFVIWALFVASAISGTAEKAVLLLPQVEACRAHSLSMNRLDFSLLPGPAPGRRPSPFPPVPTTCEWEPSRTRWV